MKYCLSKYFAHLATFVNRQEKRKAKCLNHGKMILNLVKCVMTMNLLPVKTEPICFNLEEIENIKRVLCVYRM